MSMLHVLRYSPSPDGAPSAAEWVGIDSRGAIAAAPVRGTLAEAAAALAGLPVAVLVPAVDVLLTSALLPARSQAKAARLVPFALEDQLAAELDELHFSWTRQAADGRLPVAVVAKSTIEGWLADLTAVGLTPVAFHSTADVIPDNPARGIVVIDGALAYARRPGEPPLAFDANGDASEAIRYAASALDPEGHESVTRDVIVHRADERAVLEHEPVLVTVQVHPDGLLAKLAEGVRLGEPINLLSGAYAPATDFATPWRRWRIPAFVLTALIVVHLVALAVDGWMLRRQELKLRAQELALARDALPGSDLSRAPDIKLLVESRMRRIDNAAHDGFLGLLDTLGTAVAAVPEAHVQSLSFHDGGADVVVSAPDLGTLSRVETALKGSGAGAQLQNAAMRDATHAEGHIELKVTR